MNISLGLFALSLASAVPQAQAQAQVREAPDLSYSVQVLKMNGLEWRGEYFSRLQPVTSQGGATVWTTDRETARKLAAEAPKGLKAPRVTAAPMSPVHVVHRTNRKVASGVNRLADGPFDHATKVAYTPSVEDVREGFAVTMSGRKIDQGVLAYVALDETTIAAVHQVTLTESVAGKDCCDASCDAATRKLASRIEVPEIAHTALAGEWLIPNDGALVVSLGAQTRADEQDKAVVVEHLMLIEARPLSDDAVKKVTATDPASWSNTMSATHHLPAAIRGAAGEAIITPPTPPVPMSMIPRSMPMPAMPSRTLPQARAADGSPIALPPLPADPAAPSSLPGSSEPCASPQAPNPRNEPPTIDSGSVQAGFVPEPEPKTTESSEPPHPRMIRIPLNFELKGAKFAVEIKIPAAWLFRNIGAGKDDVPGPPDQKED